MGYQITFDGFGFNDANDEYKKRLATLSMNFRNEKDSQQFGKYVENAVNSHADLLAALEALLPIGYNDGPLADAYHNEILAAEAAINKAKEGL